MIDNGRKYFTPGWIRREIRELAVPQAEPAAPPLLGGPGLPDREQLASRDRLPAHLTKRQVRGIVALARRHHVRVVPEIDMPGHMGAALARHPELQLSERAGARSPTKLDVTLPAARRFARELILEYLALFPGRYWHAGADEYLFPGRLRVVSAAAALRAGPLRPACHRRRRLPGVRQLDRRARPPPRPDPARVARRPLRRPRGEAAPRRGGRVVGGPLRPRPALAARERPPDPERRLVARPTTSWGRSATSAPRCAPPTSPGRSTASPGWR